MMLDIYLHIYIYLFIFLYIGNGKCACKIGSFGLGQGMMLRLCFNLILIGHVVRKKLNKLQKLSI